MAFEEIKISEKSPHQRSIVHGVGINDADYKISYKNDNKSIYCPFYTTWTSMLMRCYSEKFKEKYSSYKNCTCCNEWHNFSVFRAWMENQDWKGKELDKDIIILGNKYYSPETCIFVDKSINTLLHDNKKTKGVFPTGVSFDKKNNKYRASCSIENKRVNLGRYNTVDQAFHSYKNFKSSLVIKKAFKQANLILRDALILRAELIRSEAWNV